ncbi:MAG: hypothetical protein AAFZ65_18030, partial [Planctomycetota bacterium]
VDTDDTAESLDDTAEPGSKIGVAVRSTDPDRDPITFVSSDDRFEVDGDGNVVVSDLGKDAFDGVDEPEVIFDITAVANGISSGPLVITLPINAVRSEDVLAPVLIEPASTLPEDAAPGTFTGLIVFAEDPDPFDAIERFEVSGKFDVVPLDPDIAGRRAVVLADGAILDFEKLASEPVTITAVSTDGSTASTTFQIPVGDVNEPVGPISDRNDAPNQIPDTAGGGVDTGVQASATDPDAGATVRYFNAGDNRFTVVPEDGRVLVQSFAAFDAVTEPQVTATVEARSSDGSTTQQSFTIDVLGVNRPVGPVTDGNDAPDEIPETAGGGVDTGVQAVATDPDPGSIVRYFSVGDPRFTVVPEDGRVLVQTGVSFDADSEPQVTATVEARSSDGTTSRQSFTIDVLDVNLPIANLRDASADPNFVEEDAVEGAPTGIRLALDNVDPGDTVGFTITDERFTTQPVAGRRDQFYLVVSENDDFAQFRETTIRFDVTATGSDGGTVTEEFSVFVPNIDLPSTGPLDGDEAANTLTEDAASGDEVAGLELFVLDRDNAWAFRSLDARFVYDNDEERLVVADGATFDHETAPTIDVEFIAEPLGDFDPAIDIVPDDLFTTVTVEITDVEELPDLELSFSSPPEGRIPNAPPAGGLRTGYIFRALDPEDDAFELLLSDSRFELFEIDSFPRGLFRLSTADGARFDP